MRAQRPVSLLLTFVLLFALFTPISALAADRVTVEEVDNALRTVSNSLTELSDTAGQAQSVASVFQSFMDVVTTGGRILTLINGSTTFLKLIGVMTDPTQAKLDGILSTLQTIDERLSSMDDKLNDLTTAMSELKASVEFNARTEKAILYEGSWRDFEYRYMEDGMDKLLTQYSSMLRSGLMSWCGGSRSEGGVDNSRIVLLYKNTGSGYTLTYSDYNGIPSDFNGDDRWVILPAECLPASFYFDVNTFQTGLAEEIADGIAQAIAEENVGIFETQNYPLLTEEGCGDITDADIKALAADAVNTIVYRVASDKVNGDASFAGEVSRCFSNYCTHLQTSGDGVDAALKTMYLTHAFEYSAADDIRDFCDRIIILTGTYGMFAANVLGMSHTTTDAEKTAALGQMTTAIGHTLEAKENGITGSPNYCYITGTKLVYSTVEFDAGAKLTAHYTMSNTTYKSCSATAPTAYYGYGNPDIAVPAGDTAMIIIANTLASNGIDLSHAYLSENLGKGSVEDYGKIVTGYSALQTLSFDGKTKLHVKTAFGDYFRNDSVISQLPGDAESEYVQYRKKISGSLYDPSTGTLTSNTTLCAIAAYGENHFYWVTDEGAFMGGPSDSGSFRDSYKSEQTGSDSTGVIRTHSYNLSNTYNILLSLPLATSVSSEGEYSPLESLNEEIEPYGYDDGCYDGNDGDASQDQFTEPEHKKETARETTAPTQKPAGQTATPPPSPEVAGEATVTPEPTEPPKGIYEPSEEAAAEAAGTPEPVVTPDTEAPVETEPVKASEPKQANRIVVAVAVVAAVVAAVTAADIACVRRKKRR